MCRLYVTVGGLVRMFVVLNRKVLSENIEYYYIDVGNRRCPRNFIDIKKVFIANVELCIYGEIYENHNNYIIT